MEPPSLIRNGFTLVELAIVLAIIGLLIGGVMAGKSMVTMQKLRRVGTDATSYMVAMNQFKDRYGYFAGDFPTATAIWGRADGGTPVTSNCAGLPGSYAAATGKPTCNGDGDGLVSRNNNASESLWAWQQLVASGMISGPMYNGAIVMSGAPNWYSMAPGIDVPKSSIDLAGFMWDSMGIYDSVHTSTNYFTGDYNNSLLFSQNCSYGFMGCAAITPADAAQLDQKLDDGIPSTGRMRTMPATSSFAANCTTGAALAAVYNLGYTNSACQIYFMSNFVLQYNAQQ